MDFCTFLFNVQVVCVCEYVCVCVYVCECLCVFIKLHITAQSCLVILVILCHSHGSSQGGINDTCVCVCVRPLLLRRSKVVFFGAQAGKIAFFLLFSAPPRYGVRRPNNVFDPPEFFFGVFFFLRRSEKP